MNHAIPFSKTGRGSWGAALCGSLLVLAVALSGCGGATGAGTASGASATRGSTAGADPLSAGGQATACKTESGPSVSFEDLGWQSLWIENALAEYIVVHGYCQQAQSVTMTTAIGERALQIGQADVMLEIWPENLLAWYEQATKSGKVLILGNMFDQTVQGWYVPRYVIDGDPARHIKPVAPGLHSVQQLSKYYKVFAGPNNPNEGVFINCTVGWQCAITNNDKLYAYGLGKDFISEEPGSEAAENAVIAGAYLKGQPILFYYWGPTWLLGQYQMVRLQEPAYTSACNALIQKGLSNDYQPAQAPKGAGCAYDSFPTTNGVNASWAKTDPSVVGFLRHMNVGTTQIEAACAYMNRINGSAQQGADWYFKHYPNIWERWLPANVAARVRAALAASNVKVPS